MTTLCFLHSWSLVSLYTLTPCRVGIESLQSMANGREQIPTAHEVNLNELPRAAAVGNISAHDVYTAVVLPPRESWRRRVSFESR